MEESLNSAILSLKNYYEQNKNETDEKRRSLVADFFNWVKLKTEIVANEKRFMLPENIEIKRGDVFWINFGYNIDEEFGGRHPGVVLRVGSRTAIVIPLSTEEPSQIQTNSGIYVHIKKVYNFKSMDRWVNVLNTMPISIQRFDFKDKKGNIKGWELDKIREGMYKSGLWAKKQPKTT